jgi:glycosyltransferase involved in cell wall biosynthesis
MGEFGGLESFVLTLASGLSHVSTFDVELVFKKTSSFRLREELVSAISDSSAPVSFCSRASFGLWRAICRSDLIHLQNPCPDVVLMSLLARKPLLINVINHTRREKSLHQILWQACLHLAQKRYYISDFVRRSWERTEQPWHGSEVVFPICSLSSLDPLPIAQRKGFVFVARWIENKGLDILVEAYARSGLNPDIWPLRLLGNGPLRPRIMERLQQLGLAQHVEAPGFLSEYDKADQIRRSRFAVIPPNTGEDFGLVAIEARHLGVPCLITLDGGVPKAAGVHALSCLPGNVESLCRLLQRAALMPDEEYQKLATLAHTSLADELVQPDYNANIYHYILRHSS